MAAFTVKQWSSPGFLSITLISVDQLSRICVPMFIFLSWYGLEMKYKGTSIRYVQFVVSRLKKLIPLYLLWVFGSLILMSLSPSWQFSPQLSIYSKILLGQTDYQHYFVPVIIFFYLLFPLASGLTISQKKFLTPVVLLVTVMWYIFLPKLQISLTNGLLQPDQEVYLWPLTWLWYAWLGLIAADFQLIEKLNTKVGKIALLVATVLSATLMVSHAHGLVQHGMDVLLALRFTNWPVLIYATITLFSLSIIATQTQKIGWLEKLGSYSFLIYLLHTFLIRLTIAQVRVPVATSSWEKGIVVFVIILLLSKLILLNEQRPKEKSQSIPSGGTS